MMRTLRQKILSTMMISRKVKLMLPNENSSGLLFTGIAIITLESKIQYDCAKIRLGGYAICNMFAESYKTSFTIRQQEAKRSVYNINSK